MVDFNAKIVVANHQLASLLGKKFDQIQGESLAEILESRWSDPSLARSLQQLLDARVHAEAEFKLGGQGYQIVSIPIQTQANMMGFFLIMMTTLASKTMAPPSNHGAEVSNSPSGSESQRDRLERDLMRKQSLDPKKAPSEPLEVPLSLSATNPAVFCAAVGRYGEILDERVRRRGYWIAEPSNESEQLKLLAQDLANAHAGARDLVELHCLAIRLRKSGSTEVKARIYSEEGQLVALELMGRLSDAYRGALESIATEQLTDRSGLG